MKALRMVSTSTRWLLLPPAEALTCQLQWYSHTWHALKTLKQQVRWKWDTSIHNHRVMERTDLLWSYDEVKIKAHASDKAHAVLHENLDGVENIAASWEDILSVGRCEVKSSAARWLQKQHEQDWCSDTKEVLSEVKRPEEKYLKVLRRQAVLESMELTALWII